MLAFDPKWLQDSNIAAARQELACEPRLDSLRAQTQLRRQGFAPEVAAFIIEQTLLQHLASERQVFRENLPYTLERNALEQSTTWPLAALRARLLRERLQPQRMVEIGTGIGGDSLELVRSCPLITYEMDPVRSAMAGHNLQLLKANTGEAVHNFEVLADVFKNLDRKRLGGAAIFIDPARRHIDAAGQSKRIQRPSDYLPSLDAITSLLQELDSPGCVKVAPGILDEDVPPQNCLIEFISHQRTCKEAVLWLYPGAHGRHAWVLDRDNHWHFFQSDKIELPLNQPREGLVVHEPDPAIIRARAIGGLGQALQAGQLDRQIAYLIGPKTSCWHPCTQSFEIVEVLPLNQKQIRQWCQSNKIGHLEIKKRGVAIEPEAYRRGLKLEPKKHNNGATLICTRAMDQPVALMARRLVEAPKLDPLTQ